MVCERVDDDGVWQWVLRPNASLSWRGNLLFLGWMALLLGTISAVCALAGIWLVLPFAGLDIGLLAWALYHTAWRAARREVLTLSREKLEIARGVYRPSEVAEYPRAWVRVECDGERVWAALRGRRTEIGSFLRPDERLTLARLLRQQLQR
jgi:uncharacterized membrane protein